MYQGRWNCVYERRAGRLLSRPGAVFHPNPVDYLAAVLLRLQTHPASRIDELLPQNWAPPRPEPSA